MPNSFFFTRDHSGYTFVDVKAWSMSIEGDGVSTITPRATDDKGNVQYPAAPQKWNQLGHLFGAMVPHPAKITA